MFYTHISLNLTLTLYTPTLKTNTANCHFSITSQLNISYKTYTPRFYHHRKIKNIYSISFKTDLDNSTLTTKHEPSSLTTTLSALLDKHSPLICSKISIHNNSPWFNSDLCSLKRYTRKLDRLYRKTHTHQNHSNFILARNSYRHNMFCTK